MRVTCIVLVVVLAAGSVRAGDGRIEIGQHMMPYVITNSGSYVLTENLVVTNDHANGITVNASNVAVDLNGFILSSTSGTNSGGGIVLPQEFRNLSVCNGSIVGWAGSNGISAVGQNTRVDGVTVRGNGMGICLYDRAIYGGGIVSHCIAVSNIHNGIIVAEGLVVDCAAWGNGAVGIGAVGSVVGDCAAGGNGLQGGGEEGGGVGANLGSSVNRCAAVGNVGRGFSLDSSAAFACAAQSNAACGVALSTTVLLDGCAVQGNALAGVDAYNESMSIRSRGHIVRGCSVSGNGSDGVRADNNAGCLIVENVVAGNMSSGISVEKDCVIEGNHCRGNECGVTVNAVVLPANVSGNRIQGNTAVSNLQAGIRVSGYTNFIAKNFASQNPTNYDIVAGNTYNAINFSSNSWPWANINY